MGCVSSNLLNHDDDFTHLGSSALSQHIVSLTSSTYGLLTLDPPQPQTNHQPTPSTPPTPASRFALGSVFPSPLSEPKPLRSEPEVINSWELMAGLDADSFRFSTLPPPKPFNFRDPFAAKENSNPNRANRVSESRVLRPLSDGILKPSSPKRSLERFERICPPNGENRVVVYTTTLRGVRQTFEACNAVRAAIEAVGVLICERDVSMDRGFREELRILMKGKDREAIVPPRVFVKGMYVGGADEVLKIVEEGRLAELLEGLPRKKVGSVCEGCGDVKFLPCFQCNGSSKLVLVGKEGIYQKQRKSTVVKCPDCNENGLVLCPICS